MNKDKTSKHSAENTQLRLEINECVSNMNAHNHTDLIN